MKIRIASNRALLTLKQNIEYDLPKYYEEKPDSLISDFDSGAFIDTGVECRPFHLICSGDERDDFENVKKVYGQLKSEISPSMASDERLWAGLTLSPECWEYVNARWGQNGWSKSTILSHFYFQGAGRRAVMRNAISRLWWIGHLTYDESNRVDCWKYTKFVCSNQRFISDILERNMSNNKELTKTCIDACEDYSAVNPQAKITSTNMREIQKYMSILGGTYLIDSMDKEVLKKKIANRICKII